VGPKLLLVLGCALCCGFNSLADDTQNGFSSFTALTSFADFTPSQADQGRTVLLSPELKSALPWNQLIVSWNVTAPTNNFLKIEAAAGIARHQTKFYTIANWSPANKPSPRTSVPGQQDADGTVETDTLVLQRPADSAQLRLTLGPDGSSPVLKFIGLCFANTTIPPPGHPANRAAWGKTIQTPERTQFGYPEGKGWCSPTSVSMVLSRWAEVLGRAELDVPVPQVAAAVYDQDFGGTGNWPFNAAFAGQFAGMRAYVTRLDDLSEVEDWVAAGIPVVLSARWDWLEPGRPLDSEGHLIVCVGFTEAGDVIVNDPATRPERGQKVRRIYERQNVLHAWSKSHHVVYLLYPEAAKIPRDRFGHWAH
jgi:hypothetical protein